MNHDTTGSEGNVQRATEQAAHSEPATKIGARPGAEPAWTVEDARRVDFARIEPGWSVISADGEELGTVRGKGRNYLVVPYGKALERTMFVPREYVESVAAQRVILNQPYGLLIDMKLDQPPADFPEEHERVSGVPHEPLRMEMESVPQSDPLREGVAERPLPPQSPPPSASAAERAPRLERVQQPERLEQTEPVAERRLEAMPRGGFDDAALQPAQPWRDQSAPAGNVEPTLSGDVVSRAEAVAPAVWQCPAATHMDEAPVQQRGANERVGFVNSEDRAEAQFEQRSGFRVLSTSPHFDQPDGPTHQPGVKDPRSLEPLRTQFGVTGTPGEGQERNVTDLDLTRNKHPDGQPFGPQASTVGRPLQAGEPQTAQRSLPGPRGSSLARTGVKDVPPGAVMRPRPER